MSVYRLDLADKKLVDSITDSETLRRHVPRMDSFFAAIAQKRDLMANGGSSVGMFTRKCGFTPDGTMQYAATVPVSVFTAMLEIDPTFGTSKEKFIAWLKRNPQYAGTERVP